MDNNLCKGYHYNICDFYNKLSEKSACFIIIGYCIMTPERKNALKCKGLTALFSIM